MRDLTFTLQLNNTKDDAGKLMDWAIPERQKLEYIIKSGTTH